MASSFPPPPPPPPPTTTHHHHHHGPPPPPPSQPPQSVPEAEGPTGGSAAAATLLVRHLPEAIPHDVLTRLFSHYGASSVRPCAGGRLRNSAFVDFKDEALAAQAQSQLNRLRFLGKVLRVERAGKPNLKNTDQKSESQSSINPSHMKESFLNQKNLSSSEPIAPRLGVDYPFPPHLEYVYPPPDGNILTNIVNALIAVPRFYVQVLHLMNKMNIPAPFRMALPTPPLPPPVPAAPPPPSPPPPPTIAANQNPHDLSSDESEMESSEEDTEGTHSRKRRRREAIVGPAVDKGVAHEDVGLKPVSLVPKEIPVIRKKNPVLQIKVAPKSTVKDTTDNNSLTREPDSVNEHLEQKLFATPQEIESGKLPPEEILSLPMFKNYSPGNPASVLYIKNLSKDVVVDDFYFIFGSLFDSVEAARANLTIKLMQEGRMRGQAFVTFPSVESAQRALNLVNGYMFKGKPIIIQFGRNPGASKAN